MIKRALLTGVGLAALLNAGAAFSLAPYLYEDTGVQLLEDGDWEVLIRWNQELNEGDGGYEVVTPTADSYIQEEDLFAGVFKIQQTTNEVDGSNPSVNLQGDAETFTSIFLIEATSIEATNLPLGCTPSVDCTFEGDPTTVDGVGDTLQFGAVDAATWEAIYGAGGLIDVSAVLDLDDLNGDSTDDGLSDGTMALLFNGVVYDDANQGSLVNPALNTLSESATTFIDGGRLEYEFGYTGEDGATEFWTTTGIDAAMIGVAPASNNKPQNIFSLNVTQQWAGPQLDPHNYRADGYLDGSFTGPAQLQAVGSVTGIVATTTPWAVVTDTDLWIKPVPTPGTLMLLSLGLLGLGFGRLRGSKA